MEDFRSLAQLMNGDMQNPGLAESDELLMRRASRGEERAFVQLVDRHSQALFKTAFAIVGERMQAEDIVQETFLAAFRGSSGFRYQASVRTWLVGILIRQARIARRREKPAADVESAGGAAQTPADVDARMDVQQALAQVSAEHREVLVLREFEQLSYEQIATMLQVPRGTVESRLYRARMEMKEKLRGYGTRMAQ